jgi:DNA-3-methyladenine glycosylase II
VDTSNPNARGVSAAPSVRRRRIQVRERRDVTTDGRVVATTAVHSLMTTNTDSRTDVDDWRQVLVRDPVMADLVETHGPIELTPADDAFQRLCVSIVNQQLSTASANAIRERVFALFDGDEGLTPERLLAADTDALREAGLSRTKVDYLRNTAAAFRDRDLSRERLGSLSNEAVVDELTVIKGIGEWTAEMFLIFALGREDVLPLGDLAIRRGLATLYGVDEREEMRTVAEPWRPYRSYGTLYVWRSYES